MKSFITLVVVGLILSLNSRAQFTDVPFKQATSVKFKNVPELAGAELKRVLVDYNQNIYEINVT